jgi:hypothetical protein
MAKSKWLLGLLGLAFIFALAWYFLFAAITPKDQPPLTRLSSDDAFVNQFNRAASNARMVLLLSPT